MALAWARPAGERLRWVAQSSSRKPGGSPVPGAIAWRTKATCPPWRSAAQAASAS